MPTPRFKRRKEDRPQEITSAAFDAFAQNGYAATRVEDVAKRAGISKGLLYLYFKTKEELFKAVVKSVVMRRIDTLVGEIETSSLSSEDFIRGPMLDMIRRIPGSPIAIVVRLLVAEGARYPELAEFYFDNVVAKAMTAMTGIVERGIDRGEFTPEARKLPPQLFVAPAILSIFWRNVFTSQPLDTDTLIETQVDLLLAYLKTET